jgi:hypothetical protein
MLPDLERLLRLQDLETRARAAERVAASAPERTAALDARIASARSALESARAAMADHQAARRTVDRDLLAAQQRLDKYKDQSMAVKTNAEFHAMQHQMAAVKAEIDLIESRVIEMMVRADDLQAVLKTAEARLKADEAAAATERSVIEQERAAAEAEVIRCASERAAVAAQIEPRLVATFEKVARLRGTALARAEKERCVECHVRIRPVVFHTVMRNEAIVQCDSCQRILYFVPPASADAQPPGERAAGSTAPPARS